MTEHQVEMVQKTWKSLSAVNGALIGDVFYSKLFLHNPELRNMFPASMEKQHVKLIEMLTFVVSRLERLPELKTHVAALAQRHAGYGVKPVHYNLVGQALLWTLQQGLGGEWNTDVEAAWVKCYAMLAQAMIEAGSGKPV